MQSALIISPFATAPLDAGHRRRTLQMTRLLADAGFQVTFLLLAFEDPWYWRHDEDFCARLRAQWHEVILLYADRRVGRPPLDGGLHQLDEWWDAGLEQMLTNLTSRRFFDVAVVHNVWLSKAFDFLHPRTCKVLETHDLFWKRADVYARLGIKPEFFVTSESSEIFGVRRADIAVAIQDSEGAALLSRSEKTVVTVPFYDFSLEASARPMGAADYRFPDKVVFGALGSDNPFNVAGLDALLEALERVVGETFAPVELVVGGRMGERIKKRIGVKCLGFVETEAGFYEGVDFAIAPVFDGTGFKVKMADALALRAPTLLSAHAAEGAVIDASMVCATPEDMARRMADIALKRPPLTEALAHIRRARSELRDRVSAGAAHFLSAIAERTRPLVIDLSGASPETDRLALYSWLSIVRLFAGHMIVVMLLPAEVLRAVGKYLPLGVKALAPDPFRARRTWRRTTILDVFGATDAARLGVSAQDRLVVDARWSRAPLEGRGALADMPLFSANASWEPAVHALRKREAPETLARFKFPGRRTRIVFTDEALALGPLDLDGATVTVFVRVADWLDVQAAIFAVLDGLVAELVWAATPGGVGHAAARQASALRGVAFHGWVDAAALAQGQAQARFADEIGRQCNEQVAAFVARMDACFAELSSGHCMGGDHELFA